jgi:hypothetical protein
VTQIQIIQVTAPEAFDATVNDARREGDRWARMQAIQTHNHNGRLVAILVYSAPDEPTPA